MKRLLLVLAVAIFSATAAFAQGNLHKGVLNKYEYESFTSVDVSDDFIVSLTSSETYSVRVVSDPRLESYVKVFVQNGTLYVSLDRKSFSSDLKKSLKSKGAPAPVLEVEVSFPSINSLNMRDNTILHKSDMIYADAFTLTMTDKARADKLPIDCKTAELNLDRSSYADVEAAVDEMLFISTANTSKVVVKQTGKSLKIDALGASMVDAIIDVEDVEVVSSGTSATKFISGRASNVKVNASASSKVDAESVQISKGTMEQSGLSKCYMNVTDTLKVNLTGSTMLTFKNKPYIDVERIVGSTLIKADDPRRR